jgi:hypothetical protein
VHAGKPAKTGAAHQAQQKGLCLIVPSVADRDEVGASRQSRAFEKLVTRRTRGIFERAPFLAGTGGDVTSIDDKRPGE